MNVGDGGAERVIFISILIRMLFNYLIWWRIPEAGDGGNITSAGFDSLIH